MLTNEIVYGIAAFSLIFGLSGFLMGLIAIIEVKAMQKSTHSVQYMPLNMEDVRDENWGTSEESLEKQRNLFKEDLEDNMPEFALDEDDRQRYSF